MPRRWNPRALLAALRRNPFYRREVARKRRRWLTGGLAGMSLAYVQLLLGALLLRAPAGGGGQADVMSAAFTFAPWLLLGAGILILCAHWLVPASLVRVLCRGYELDTLRLMVGGKHRTEDVLRGQVAAGLVPPIAGMTPLVLALPVLARFGPAHLPHSAGALAAALLWTGLCAAVSVWCGVSWRNRRPALLHTYALTSVVLPAVIAPLAVVVGLGCSVGHENRFPIFLLGAALTWAILVAGAAALFCDLTAGRLFPERRQPLWQATEHAQPLEP